MKLLFITLILFKIASAGKIEFTRSSITSGCGLNACALGTCDVWVQDLHGCTGSASCAAPCGNNNYQHFNDLCGGDAAVSIDWRKKPLIAQFQNGAGDFSECTVKLIGDTWKCEIS